MENKAHAMIAGIFTIAMLAMAVLAAIWFNRDREVRVPYQIATRLSVPGLNPQAAVRYRGLDVGRVDRIGFDPQTAGQILVDISVRPDTPITRSTFATLGYQGVTGIAFIQLDDEKTGSALMPSRAEQMARIPLRPGLLDQLEKRGTIILDKAERIANSLDTMLSPENQKIIVGAFDKVGKTADAYAELPKQIEPTLARLPALATKAGGEVISADQY